MDSVERLGLLCNTFGPAGYEDEVRELILNWVTPLADEVRVSPLGNLLVTKKGEDDSRTFMLDAHMDEVGLIVTHVDANGFLRFGALGGVDPRIVPSQRVLVRAADGRKYRGVIGAPPPHVTESIDRTKAHELKDLVIDAGFTSRESAAARGVEAGAPAAFDAELVDLADGCVAAKALDDRAGCTVLMQVLESLAGRKPPVNVVFCFSTQEETGGFGAQTAAFGVAPEVALALEGTTATDCPDTPAHRVVAELRKGPAITIADAVTIVPGRMVTFLREQAAAAGIPYQMKTPKTGGTNGRLIQTSRAGVLTGILNVPCRYIHSSVSVCHGDDLRHTAALVKRVVDNVGRLWD